MICEINIDDKGCGRIITQSMEQRAGSIVNSSTMMERRYPKRPGVPRLIIDLSGVSEEELMPISQKLLLDLEARSITPPDSRKRALELLDDWEQGHSLPSIRAMYNSQEWESVVVYSAKRWISILMKLRLTFYCLDRYTQIQGIMNVLRSVKNCWFIIHRIKKP